MLNQVPLENTKNSKYLGSVKTPDGTCSKDIKMRIETAKNNIWKECSITADVKIKLLKHLIWPMPDMDNE